jgi:hypothetical protein
MMKSKRNIKTKKLTTTLDSKVSNQEPPYHKFMDQNHVAATHILSSYPYFKVQRSLWAHKGELIHNQHSYIPS